VLCAFFTAVSLCACGGEDKTPTEIADHIMKKIEFSELVKFDESQSFLNVDAGLVSECIVYTSRQEDKADELIVIQPADSKNFDLILAEVQTHISARADNFSEPAPAEAAKIRDAVIRRVGGCIVVVICGQSGKAGEVLRGMGARGVK